MPKPNKKIADILSTEMALTAEVDVYNDPAFNAERDRRTAAGNKLDASPEDKALHAEIYSGDFGRSWGSRRDAAYAVLQNFRIQNWTTFRDEFLTDALQKIEELVAEVDAEIAALEKKYPGLRLKRDPDYRASAIRRLEELLDRSQITGHEVFGDMAGDLSL